MMRKVVLGLGLMCMQRGMHSLSIFFYLLLHGHAVILSFRTNLLIKDRQDKLIALVATDMPLHLKENLQSALSLSMNMDVRHIEEGQKARFSAFHFCYWARYCLSVSGPILYILTSAFSMGIIRVSMLLQRFTLIWCTERGRRILIPLNAPPISPKNFSLIRKSITPYALRLRQCLIGSNRR